MEIKKEKVVKAYLAFNKLKSQGESKFKYAILKNLKSISNEISILQDIEKENQLLIQDYQGEFNTIISEYSTDGMVKASDENYPIVLQKIQELKDKYKDKLDQYEQKNKDYEEILNEVYDFTPYKIDIENVHKDINCEDLELLMELNIID